MIDQANFKRIERRIKRLVAEGKVAPGTPTRRAETTGSVGEADGGPTLEEGDAHE